MELRQIAHRNAGIDVVREMPPDPVRNQEEPRDDALAH